MQIFLFNAFGIIDHSTPFCETPSKNFGTHYRAKFASIHKHESTRFPNDTGSYRLFQIKKTLIPTAWRNVLHGIQQIENKKTK
jgi:hypothetical protein